MKKVRFQKIPEIRYMYAWSFAYNAARRSNWQQICADRFRFERRIEKMGKILEPVLKRKVEDVNLLRNFGQFSIKEN